MTALTNVVENLRADLDNNMVWILDLLDHSKACDLKKLFCFSETACRLLRSYLTGRSQIVSYNGTCSESLNVNRGLPQWFTGALIYFGTL